MRNHVYEFLYVDIGHVVIQSAEDMIAARRLVKGGELEFGGFANEAHLLNHHHAIADIHHTAQFAHRLAEGRSKIDACIERDIHSLGHHENRGAALFGRLCCGCCFLRIIADKRQ